MLIKKIALFLTVSMVALTVAACDSSGDASVTGDVTYILRIALPPDAVVTVQIQDISKADAQAEVIGEQIIQTDGKQVPIPFEVAYDPKDFDERFTYSIFAKITDGEGKLLFITDTVIPVITKGNPTSDVEVMVVQVGG